MGLLLRFWLLTSLGLAVGLDGRPVTEILPPGSRVVVLFFAASDCPVSNRYVPEMEKLAREFAPLGVKVWFVYPNPGDSAELIRAHNQEFGITVQTALDSGQTLTKMTGATTTPEAAILIPQGGTLHEVYRGRIDDRYVNLGTERPQATRHDLEDAIRAAVAGRPVPQPGGPAIGCSIVTRQR
jgi:thiol-disulfide isomerase/thioredoxin